jgi:HPt (histidine-containing phosphotransfer) domain-containing protein
VTIPSPIDPAAFANLVDMTGGDLAFVDDLVDTYVDEGGQLVEALRIAAAEGRIADLVRPAHSLKSSSRNVGALALGELCAGLERDARDGRLADAAGRVDAIVAAFGEAGAALLEARGARAPG